MISTTNGLNNKICVAWVAAHHAFCNKGDGESMRQFTVIDQLLLEAVAEGWNPNPLALEIAFESLRENLRTVPTPGTFTGS